MAGGMLRCAVCDLKTFATVLSILELSDSCVALWMTIASDDTELTVILMGDEVSVLGAHRSHFLLLNLMIPSRIPKKRKITRSRYPPLALLYKLVLNPLSFSTGSPAQGYRD